MDKRLEKTDYSIKKDEDIKTFSVKIKTPHGRLIDEDALCYEVVKKGGVDFIYAATSCIKDTPTVIEADYND